MRKDEVCVCVCVYVCEEDQGIPAKQRLPRLWVESFDPLIRPFPSPIPSVGCGAKRGEWSDVPMSLSASAGQIYPVDISTCMFLPLLIILMYFKYLS